MCYIYLSHEYNKDGNERTFARVFKKATLKVVVVVYFNCCNKKKKKKEKKADVFFLFEK